jgi:gamma-glutamyltranspeptidase
VTSQINLGLLVGLGIETDLDGIESLEIENRVSAAVLDELRTKGHDVKELAAWGHGSSVQLMQVLPDKTYAFGSDPRCEGHASGI